MTKYTLLLWAIGQAFQRRLLSRMRLRRACCNALKWKTTNSGWNAMTGLHRTTTLLCPGGTTSRSMGHCCDTAARLSDSRSVERTLFTFVVPAKISVQEL